MIFTKIDRYIIRKYFVTLGFILLLLALIIAIFDVSQKIDDFIKNKAGLLVIIKDYYFNFLPFMLNMLLPLFIFVSVIFFTSRMAAQSEIIAIMNAGVSINRMLRPYLICGLLLTILSTWLYNMEIPHNQKARYAFENIYVTPNRASVSRNLHRQIQPGLYLYMETFMFGDSSAYRFNLDKMMDKQLVQRLTATRIIWNKQVGKWRLENWVLREIGPEQDKITSGMYLDTALVFHPEDFILDDHSVEKMDYDELNAFIQREEQRGSDLVEGYRIEKYQRFAMPFSAIILSVIGFCVSFRKRRDGMGFQVVVALLLSFAYILLMRFASEFARGHLLPGWLAVWIPNILYAGLAVYWYLKARD